MSAPIFTNRIRVIRRPDHFVLVFGLQTKDQADEPAKGPVAGEGIDIGEEVAQIVVPFTAGVDLCLELFTAMARSAMDLQGYFNSIQGRVNQLNQLIQTPKK